MGSGTGSSAIDGAWLYPGRLARPTLRCLHARPLLCAHTLCHSGPRSFPRFSPLSLH